MIAHFYLLANSFAHNNLYSSAEIERKVKSLFADFSLIHSYSLSNKLYANFNELYGQVFYETYTIEDFYCNQRVLKENGVDKDIISSLMRMFDIAEQTTITIEEVRDEMLLWNDESNVHGLICFHTLADVDESLQVIYGAEGWRKFRRFYLGKYPQDGTYFIDECKIYFPNLFFHERNKSSCEYILRESSNKLVHYLSELNDKFNQSRTSPYTRVETLRRFNTSCSFDQKASDEGNSDSRKKSVVKKRDSFDFYDKEGKKHNICCDLHLKLLKDDKGKISTDRRIYFCEGNSNIEKGKILVGHIGIHL